MARIKRTLFWAVVSASVLCAGCTQEQLARIDRGVSDANQVAQGISELAQGPAGLIMPAWVRGLLEALGLVGGLAVVTWQQLRNSGIFEKLQTVTAAGKTIVQAVEELPADQAKAVKDAVGEKMQATAAKVPGLTYDALNAVVDSLKT